MLSDINREERHRDYCLVLEEWNWGEWEEFLPYVSAIRFCLDGYSPEQSYWGWPLRQPASLVKTPEATWALSRIGQNQRETDVPRKTRINIVVEIFSIRIQMKCWSHKASFLYPLEAVPYTAKQVGTQLTLLALRWHATIFSQVKNNAPCKSSQQM